jgi:anti-anti-sigma regulatory factor
MPFKIDTKERFQVVSLPSGKFSASLAEELKEQLEAFLTKNASTENEIPRNIVVSFKETSEIDAVAAETLLNLHQYFYANNCSFVCCELSKELQNQFEELEILDILNITPTESEAWDIVQMEEIEREILGSDDSEI